MKRYILPILILLFIGCSTPEVEPDVESETFVCPEILELPQNAVGTVDNLFQGDILITDKIKQVGAVTELWDDKIVPLYFDERWSEEQKNFIKGSLWQLEIEGFTFPEISQEEIFEGNSIYVKYSGIAASYIGKSGGNQNMYLPVSWLSSGVIAHEFGHAVGLHHPHVTDMQGEWLTIYWDNIKEERKSFFRTYREYDSNHVNQTEGFEYGDEYDIYSVMNYGSNAFAIDPMKPTMTLKDGTWFKPGGQLSEGDILSIRRMYDCYEKNK